jgi:hypothetical protein
MILPDSSSFITASAAKIGALTGSPGWSDEYEKGEVQRLLRQLQAVRSQRPLSAIVYNGTNSAT